MAIKNVFKQNIDLIKNVHIILKFYYKILSVVKYFITIKMFFQKQTEEKFIKINIHIYNKDK